ncbi:MAG: hypothetical protein RIE32_06825 [Phycisphaerales bacterium]
MHARTRPVAAALAAVLPLSLLTACATTADPDARAEPAARVHYLEIVTPDVAETCALLGQTQGLRFGEPVAELGLARTAPLAGGGRVGVRPIMAPGEGPVVRPYVLVDDLDAAVQAARDAGAQIAIDRMAIPGQGVIAIYILGGIEHGLWMLEGDDEDGDEGG